MLTVSDLAAMPRTEFRGAAISNNANSFGLRGVILVGLDGEAWEVGITSQFCPKIGEAVKVPKDGELYLWGAARAELPRSLPSAPQPVVAQVWGL